MPMQEPMTHAGASGYGQGVGAAAPAGPAASAAAGASSTGSSPGGAARRIDFHRLSPQQQRQALLELVRDGRNDEEIGELFGLSQWQVRNLRYRLGIKKDRGGNVHLEPIRLRGADVADGVEALESGDGRPRLALTLEGEFSGATLASYLEGITGFVRAAGSRPFRVRCFVCEAEADEPGPSGR